jgi:hypothetical protein
MPRFEAMLSPIQEYNPELQAEFPRAQELTARIEETLSQIEE